MNEILKYIIFFLLGIVVYYFLFTNPSVGSRKVIEGFITDEGLYNEENPRRDLITVPIFLKTNYKDVGTGEENQQIRPNAVGNIIRQVPASEGITIEQMFQEDGPGITLNKDLFTVNPEESIFFNKTTYYDNNTSPTNTNVARIAELSDGTQPEGTVYPADIDHLKIKGVIPNNITMSYLQYEGDPTDTDPPADFLGTLDYRTSLPEDLALDLSVPDMSNQENMLVYFNFNVDNALIIQFNLDEEFPDRRNLPTDNITVYFKLTLVTNINDFTRVRSTNEVGEDTISKTQPSDTGEPSVITGTLPLDNINELTNIRRIYEKVGGQETQNISIQLNTKDYNAETIALGASSSILSIQDAPSGAAAGVDVVKDINYNPLTIDLFFYSFFIVNTEVLRAVSTGEDELKYAELLNIIFLGTGDGGRFSSLTGCESNARSICQEINEEYSKDGSLWVPKTADLSQDCIPTKTGPLRALTGGRTCFEDPTTCCKDISCSTVFFSANHNCGERLALPNATCDLEMMGEGVNAGACDSVCCDEEITDISRKIFNDIRTFSKKIRVHNRNTIRMSDIHNYIIYYVINIETTFNTNDNGIYTDLGTNISLNDKTLSVDALTASSDSNIQESDFDSIKDLFRTMVTNPEGGSLIQIDQDKLSAIILRDTGASADTEDITSGLFTGGLDLSSKFSGVDGTERFSSIEDKYKYFYETYIQGDSGGSALHQEYNLERTIKENVVLLSHTFNDSLNTFEGVVTNPLTKYSSLSDDAEISLSRFQLLL
tara:strand:+ start:29 stop:2344 length:2316 start_codon:yes stop_codon:yes gene_type:complete